ncbi:MAG: hypothetical protein L0H70_02855 [Xanthomonadales bacterium]|nr:hypothetical protein [Xanthomonadales bacterium]
MDKPTQTFWWVASVGNALIWSRLRVLPSGHAEIFAADGRTLQFDDVAAARAALLDAEFRAYDGLDDHDADALGFELAHMPPPHAEDDAQLLALMTHMLE